MYKWPQGKFIRMALLTLTVIAAIDCGWESYVTANAWVAAGDQAIWQQVAVAGVLAVLALAFFIVGGAAVAFVPRSVNWLIEVEQEMLRVTWPKQNEIVRSTVIIAIMTVVLALVIFLVDWLNIQVVVNGVLNRGGV